MPDLTMLRGAAPLWVGLVCGQPTVRRQQTRCKTAQLGECRPSIRRGATNQSWIVREKA